MNKKYNSIPMSVLNTNLTLLISLLLASLHNSNLNEQHHNIIKYWPRQVQKLNNVTRTK